METNEQSVVQPPRPIEDIDQQLPRRRRGRCTTASPAAHRRWDRGQVSLVDNESSLP